MKRISLCILPLIVLISCSTSHETVKHAPAAPMENYNTIAIAKFVSPDPSIGLRAAERLAVKFAEAGFTVTRYEKIKKLYGRDILSSPELSPAEKAALQANGIKAVLYGNIDSYECKTQKEWTWTGTAPEKTSYDLCRASLSIRVVDAATGEIIWQTQGSNSEKADSLTARMVIEKVLSKIEDEIPKINK